MILYVHLHQALLEPRSNSDPDSTTLQCATVVLQHPDGPVGFNRGLGTDALKALVHDVVVIERANSPDWIQLREADVSSRVFHSRFRRVMTCSFPRQPLLEQLENVSLNKQRSKKNEILARHGKHPKPLTPTMFDDWIDPNGLPKHQSVAWLIASSPTVAMWSFSERGMYASIFARSADAALESILRAARELDLPLHQVHSESDLPAW